MPERERWRKKPKALLTSAERGTSAFNQLMSDVRSGYVDAHYPGLQSYAYNAELISVDDGESVMRRILKEIDWIEWPIDDHPAFHLRGEPANAIHSIVDSDSFPQPTVESIDGDGGEEGD